VKKSPTQRSLAHLREQGFLCAVVERWNPHAGVRQDLYGFIDVLAIREGETLAVQACARGSVSERLTKILEHPNYPRVKSAGWSVVIHGWGKMASGKYELREVTP
jgi:hypothetical protein